MKREKRMNKDQKVRHGFKMKKNVEVDHSEESNPKIRLVH